MFDRVLNRIGWYTLDTWGVGMIIVNDEIKVESIDSNNIEDIISDFWNSIKRLICI